MDKATFMIRGIFDKYVCFSRSRQPHAWLIDHIVLWSDLNIKQDIGTECDLGINVLFNLSEASAEWDKKTMWVIY